MSIRRSLFMAAQLRFPPSRSPISNISMSCWPLLNSLITRPETRSRDQIILRKWSKTSRNWFYMYSRHRAGPERRESEPRTYLVKTLMKRLNWLLRYGVGYKLVNTRPDGFVRVHDILTSRGLRGYDMASFQEIMKLDFLRRFELRWEFCGHLCAKELFVRLAKEEMKIPVEGVDRGNKKIARITNLPPVAQYTLTPDRWSDISHHGIPKAAGNLIHLHAIRNNPLEVDYSLSNCVILVDIDTHAAFYAGISFYIAKNKDLVTEGDPNGVLPPIYFKKAVKVAYECHQLV